MGGCATKLKGVKEDAAEAPAPETAKEEVAVVSEVKEDLVDVVEKKIDSSGGGGGGEDDKDKEIVDIEKVDDEQADKRRSLSHLFMETEEAGKDWTDEQTPSQPAKPEEKLDTEKATEKSETEAPEVEKSEAAIEQAEPITETPKPETFEEEKAVVTENLPATEAQKTEETEEKKTEEEKKGGEAA